MKYNDLVTIQIVLYEENRDIIFNCLDKLKSFRKIILDNSNNKKLKIDIEKKYTIDHYFLEKKNIGFSNGHNKCAKHVQTEYLLILNADCIIDENSVIKLIESFSVYDDIAIASPTTFDNNLNYTYNGGLLPEYGNKDIITKIDGDTCFQSVLGSAMMVKKNDFFQIGMFNNNLFLYYSDDDLCRKFIQKKKAIIQVYESKAYHSHGISKVQNIFKRIFLREYNMTFDELYYFYIIKKDKDKLDKLRKKIFTYFYKIILNCISFNFKKATFHYAKILGFMNFVLKRRK